MKSFHYSVLLIKPKSIIIVFNFFSGSPFPTTLIVDCSNVVRGTCSLARGSNHTVTVTFTPRQDSSHVVSSLVSWRTWFELPLPGQDKVACNHLQCPLVQGKQTTFSYPLNMPDYVMRVSLRWFKFLIINSLIINKTLDFLFLSRLLFKNIL